MNGAITALAGYGDLLVIVVLLGMSVWGLKIAIDRVLVLRRFRSDLEKTGPVVTEVVAELRDLGVDSAEKFDESWPVVVGPVTRNLKRGVAVLGTMGNSAPFIGLFGTVLGVIKAFQDLAMAQQAGPQVVMGGISQALIATALGLFVAIPAVIAFNYFSIQLSTALATLREQCWRDVCSGDD